MEDLTSRLQGKTDLERERIVEDYVKRVQKREEEKKNIRGISQLKEEYKN